MKEEELAKYFSGEMTQGEMDEIHSWREDSFDNTKVFLEAKNLWFSSGDTPAPDQKVLDRILDSEESTKTFVIKRVWYKYAAAVAMIIGLSAMFYFNRSNEGSMGTYALEDGSQIVLHGDSELSSIKVDETSREVTLMGKAYFDIEKDEKRPFIINTSNARIKVLGTSFQIDSYSDKKTEVIVESGLVYLIKPGERGKADLSVKLAEGETGTVNYTSKGILKKNNRNRNYLAWKTKSLAFERTTMAEVKKTLEDVYGINVEFENASLLSCKLTAKFNERKAKDAIAIISKTFNLTYEFKENKVIFKGKGC